VSRRLPGAERARPRSGALVLLVATLASAGCASLALEPPLPRIGVAPDGRGFIEVASGRPFRPSGFNYDHDGSGRLIEDYWVEEWSRVEADFAAMRALGANVVRVHLQAARFLGGPTRVRTAPLQRFERLLRLAARNGMYLDVTGLGAYHAADVPAWYDALDEEGRWRAQETFWRAIARAAAGNSTVFCYDLMNEPLVPVARVEPRDWLPGEPFGGKQFVQYVTLDPAGRPRSEIARAWTRRMVDAVRSADRRALVTVGLVPWSADTGEGGSGFAPVALAPLLDFLALHIYPEQGRADAARQIVSAFQVGRPVLIEEIFPLATSPEELAEFRVRVDREVAGWIGFFRPYPWPLPADTRGLAEQTRGSAEE